MSERKIGFSPEEQWKIRHHLVQAFLAHVPSGVNPVASFGQHVEQLSAETERPKPFTVQNESGSFTYNPGTRMVHTASYPSGIHISPQPTRILEALKDGLLQEDPDSFVTYDQLRAKAWLGNPNVNQIAIRKQVEYVRNLIGPQFLEGKDNVGYRLRGTLIQQ